MKIIMEKNKTITRKELFEAKEKFHKSRAKMPFEEKIRILVELQKISYGIRPDKKKTVWKI